MNEELKEKFANAVKLRKSGCIFNAEVLLNDIVKEYPEEPNVLFEQSMLYVCKHDFDRAKICMDKVVNASGNYFYYKNIGNFYLKNKLFEKAKESYLELLKHIPNDYDTIFNMGLLYFHSIKLHKSKIYFYRVFKNNQYDAMCCFRLAYNYFELYELDKAQEYCVKAIEIKKANPKALILLAYIFLLKGNFDEGWKLFETRFFIEDSKNRIKLTTTLWKGESLEGKTIFIDREQGLGDCLLFSRYVLLLNSMGAKVIFRPDDKLKQLFIDSDFPAQIIDKKVPLESFSFDYYQSVMSIPAILNSNEETIPYKNSYLKANPAKVAEYKEKYFKTDKLKVGIVWQCKNYSKRDEWRSIPDLSYLFPLLRLPNIEFYSLQKGKGEPQLDNLPKGIKIHKLGRRFKNMSDTAAAIKNLDIVITVDTSVVHLAGALGKKTLLLLDYTSEWRWQLNRSDSIWYDSVHIFRQKAVGAWHGVIEDLVDYISSEYSSK